MRIYIFIIFYLLIACSSQNKDGQNKVDKNTASNALERADELADLDDKAFGSVITSITADNIPYHFFYFSIKQIYLVNSITNETVSISPVNNRYTVNISAKVKSSEIVAIHENVPPGIYNQAIILISMEDSVIIPSNLPEMAFPLIDVEFNPIPQSKSEFTVETSLADDKALTVEKDKISRVALSFDVDASMRYVLTTGNNVGILYTPQFIIDTDPVDNHFQFSGLIEKVSEDNLTINHVHKVNVTSDSYTFPYEYTVKGKPFFTNGFNQDSFQINNDMWGVFSADTSMKDNKIGIQIQQGFFYESNNDLGLFKGVISQVASDHFIGSGLLYSSQDDEMNPVNPMINKTITFGQESIIYYQEEAGLKSADIQFNVGQPIWVTTDIRDKTPFASMIYLEPSRVLAKVVEKARTTQGIRVEPLSYNNIDRLNDDYETHFPKAITLTNISDDFEKGTLLDIKGYHLIGLNDHFFATNHRIITKTEEVILSIALPVNPVLSAINSTNTGLTKLSINPQIYENNALINIRYPKSNAQYSDIPRFTTIHLDNAQQDTQYNVLIDGVYPVQSLFFHSVEKFSDYLTMIKSDSRYVIAEVIARGVVDEKVFVARELSLVVIEKQDKATILQSDVVNAFNAVGEDISNETMRILHLVFSTGAITSIVVLFRDRLIDMFTRIKFHLYDARYVIKKRDEYKQENIQRLIELANKNARSETFETYDLNALNLDDFNEDDQVQAISKKVNYNLELLKIARKVTWDSDFTKAIQINEQLLLFLNGYNQDNKSINEQLALSDNQLKDIIDKINPTSKALEDNVNEHLNRLIRPKEDALQKAVKDYVLGLEKFTELRVINTAEQANPTLERSQEVFKKSWFEQRTYDYSKRKR